MKRTLLLGFLLYLFATPLFAQQPTAKSAFLEKWENSRNYLIAVLDSVPEDSLDFKPTSRQMSVRDQLKHIRMNMLWLGHTYFSDGHSATNEAIARPEGKAELRAALEKAFNEVYTQVAASDDTALSEEVEFFAGPKTKLQILNLLQDHVTHHRGQLIVYLNLMNLTPPPYTGW